MKNVKGNRHPATPHFHEPCQKLPVGDRLRGYNAASSPKRVCISEKKTLKNDPFETQKRLVSFYFVFAVD